MPERWEELQDAFHQALDLDPEARVKFLKALQERDPDLYKQVAELLAADADESKPLDTEIAESMIAQGAVPEDPWVGKEIGPWHIQERIGAGGMGTVFRANRTEKGFTQVAAIKIMAAPLMGSEAMVRFRVERQILATLNHRSIARLVDGGETPDGLPYLVMDYINGQPIDHYCNQNQLSVPARLTLIRKICDAVDFAHRNLVVHRDLKPSNILVEADGEPKLLDFGIAKLLEPGAYETTLAQTGPGGQIMTPEYASPEQVRGEPTSVASDVYALGVLLFRLLTGHSPYLGSTSSRRELETAILDMMPKRPSLVVAAEDLPESRTEQTSPGEPAQDRKVSVKRLRRRLSGDVDNIVLKCLQKEPHRRYATARDLAADIERHLDQRPVLARGNDWTYKTRKFFQRHAMPLAAAAAVTATLIGMSVVYTVRVVEERDKAEFAARQAEEVSDFLSTLFTSASPFVSRGEEITAVNLIEQGEAKIDDLTDQPLLQAKLYSIMGNSFTELGDYRRGNNLNEKSVAILDNLQDVDPLLLADSLFSLAESQRQLDRFDDSIATQRRVVALREQVLGRNHPDVAYAIGRLGSSLVDDGQSEEALHHLTAAMEIKQRLGQGDDEEALNILGVRVVTLASMGRFEEARTVWEEVLSISEDLLGPLHPNTVIRTNNRGINFHRLYRSHDGLVFVDEAIARGQEIWVADHPQLAYFYRFRARLLQRLGLFSEAKTQLDYTGRLTPEQSTSFPFYHSGVGMWYRQTGDFDSAEAAYQRAIPAAIEVSGASSPATAFAMIGLGLTYAETGRFSEAEVQLNAALDMKKSHQIELWIARRTLASVYSQQGRLEEAEALFEAVLEEQEQRNGQNSGILLETLIHKAAHHGRSGDVDQAVAVAHRAGEVGREVLPSGNWIVAVADAELAKALLQQGQTVEAVPLLRRAADRLRDTFGSDDYRVQELDLILSDQ